ncbi:DUF6702 family protein [Rhodocaloribacter sp.]
MTPILILLLSLAAPVSDPPPHDFHVTYGRLAVEGPTAMLRIRFFHDDLEAALRAHHKRRDFRLEADPLSDSLFLAYFHDKFALESDGAPLRGEIVTSGEEREGRERVWWYVLRYDAPAPIRSLTVRDALLFEVFSDQKNIFRVLHLPDEKRETFYFVEGSAKAELTF